MARFSLSQRTSSGTAAAACWEIIASSTARPRVVEIGISINAATASVFGLGRPAAIGVTPTTPVTFLPDLTGNSTTTAGALAWGTGPTVPAAFFRRVSTPAAIGSGVVWTFPEGLWIPASGSLVIWNIGTNSVADVWAVIEE